MTDEKILENEKLEVEELDSVAGGTTKEIKRDINFFQAKGLLPGNASVKDTGAIKNAWGKFGIDVILKEGAYSKTNQYFLNGKSISRNEALQIVEDKFYSSN